jgi:hypothetical protein
MIPESRTGLLNKSGRFAQQYCKFTVLSQWKWGSVKMAVANFMIRKRSTGRYIWIRFSIWKISDDSAQSEQAFSDDGGKTWETNWVNKYTRVKQ